LRDEPVRTSASLYAYDKKQNTVLANFKLKPEKKKISNGIRTHDLCDTGAIKPTGSLFSRVRVYYVDFFVFFVLRHFVSVRR